LQKDGGARRAENLMNQTSEPGHDSGVPTPDELERKGDAIRADLDRTLEALERKLSPRALANRSATYVREQGAQLLEEAGDTMRRHPVSLLLCGAAVVWMATSLIRKRREASYYHDYVRSPAGRAARRAWQRARDRGQTTAESMRERVGATMRSVRDHIADTPAQVDGFMPKQPLMVGLLAAVAGALIGAALPVSEPE
jgi:ElaB/YqjD/DUF883 family membrane-anchored ribosome-binding protein